MQPKLAACAVAHSNIALVKYWGKLAREGNYPAVPSLSLTLDGFYTRTEVTFDHNLKADEFELDGKRASSRALERVVRLLDVVRAQASLRSYARVDSSNNFPTASGLASSASGFAALALAATRAAQLDTAPGDASALARSCSASAARSIFGGWVTLESGAESAAPLAGMDPWPVALVIAVTDAGQKALGSTEAMNRSANTSPCYGPWVETSKSIFARACAAAIGHDIEALGTAMEESTWLMHSTMLTAKPAVVYLTPATIEVIHEVRRRRSSSVPAYFTTDAGPHVKVLTLAEHVETVKSWLHSVSGVTRVEVCRPGPNARTLTDAPGGT